MVMSQGHGGGDKNSIMPIVYNPGLLQMLPSKLLMNDSQIPPQAATHKAQADKYRDSGNLPAAVESYRTATELAPRFWQAHANLSMLLAESGDHTNSVVHAEKAVEIMPDMAELFDNLGVIYREAGRYPEAIKAHKQAVEKNPSLISGYFNLGLDCVKSSDLEEAVAAFRKVIEINPNVPEAHLYTGNLLLQQNRSAEAETYYRSALKFNPSQPAVVHNLGQCLQDQGKLDEAIEAYQQVIQLNPKSAGSYFNLGVAQQEQTLLDEAVDSYTKALSLDSKICDAYFNLGVIYKDQERLDDAVVCYRKAIRCNPKHEESLTNLGDVLRIQGALDDAAIYLEEALALNPRSFKAHAVLGNVLQEQGESKKAVAAFQQAIAINPGSKEAHNNLGLALREQEQEDEAVASFRQALQLDSRYKEAHFNIGSIYESMGRVEDAVAAYQQALKVDAEYKVALYRLGIAYNERGEKEAALSCFRDVIRIDPADSAGYMQLARTKKHTERDGEVEAMESLYAQEDELSEKRKNLAFGLAKVYEDLRDYDKAFTYMADANRIKRSVLEYSEESVGRVFDILKTGFNRDFLGNGHHTGVMDDAPIFIVGMPRSGTSLVEQILASHPQVYGAGELTYIDSIIRRLQGDASEPYSPLVNDEELFAKIGREYLVKLREHSPTARHITDKLPHNFLNIGIIRKSLPNSKIIRCSRDPMDNCLSIYKLEFQGSLPFAYDLEELGRFYLRYQDLMRHWHAAMPGVIYDIQYEELVADQENQTRKLLEYCGLPWDDACLAFHKTERRVATASLTQVRQPIYRDSVQLWKRYEKQLEPLRRIIESRPRG